MEYYVERITQPKRTEEEKTTAVPTVSRVFIITSLFLLGWSSNEERNRNGAMEKERAKKIITPTPLSKATANVAISTYLREKIGRHDFYL